MGASAAERRRRRRRGQLLRGQLGALAALALLLAGCAAGRGGEWGPGPLRGAAGRARGRGGGRGHLRGGAAASGAGKGSRSPRGLGGPGLPAGVRAGAGAGAGPGCAEGRPWPPQRRETLRERAAAGPGPRAACGAGLSGLPLCGVPAALGAAGARSPLRAELPGGPCPGVPARGSLPAGPCPCPPVAARRRGLSVPAGTGQPRSRSGGFRGSLNGLPCAILRGEGFLEE